MSTETPHSLAAAADQVTQETLGLLRGMAREHDGKSQNLAAVALAHRLAEMPASTLANALANALLDQVRTADANSALAGVDVDADLSNVEVRVIGPEAAARAILAKMAAAGIPAHDTSDPMEAVERPDTVRFYTYTDPQLRAAMRKRRNSGHRRGNGRTR